MNITPIDTFISSTTKTQTFTNKNIKSRKPDIRFRIALFSPAPHRRSGGIEILLSHMAFKDLPHVNIRFGHALEAKNGHKPKNASSDERNQRHAAKAH